MGKLVDLLTNPNSPLFDANGDLKPEFQDPAAMKSFILQHQHEDPDWMNAPNDKKLATLKAVGVDTTTMQVAAQRKAELDRQNAAQQIPDGTTSVLGGAVHGLLGGIIKPTVDAIKGPESGINEDPRARLGRVGLDVGQVAIHGLAPYAMGVIDAGSGAAGASAANRAMEEGQGRDVAAVEREKYEALGNLAGAVGAAGSAVADYAGGAAARAAGRVAETESGPIKLKSAEPELVTDPDTGHVMEENEPPPAGKQEDLNLKLQDEGVDPNDSTDVIQSQIAKKTGKQVPVAVSVGDTNVSTSKLTDQGAEADLATGAPIEAVHEGEHLSADINGTEQPPEDNTAIIDKELYQPTGVPVTNPTAVRMRARMQPPEGPVKEPYQSETWMRNNDPGAPPAEDVPPMAVDEPMSQGEKPGVGAGMPDQAQPGTIGPKEAAALGEDPNAEPWLADKEKAGPGSSIKPGKGKGGITPAPTPAEGVRNATVAQKIARVFQATAASASGPKIAEEGALRLFVHAITKAPADLMAGGGDPWEGFDMLSKIFNRGDVNQVMKQLQAMHPDELAKFLQSPMQEMGASSRLADLLGTPNRIAHLIPKTAAATVRLANSAKSIGIDIYQPGQLAKVPKEMIEDSLNWASKMNYAATPESGTAAATILRGLQTPPGRLVALFPRIVYNKLRTIGDFNPLMAAKLLKPGNYSDPAQIYKGISGLIGSGLVAAGWEMQEKHPDFLGVPVGGGNKIDLKYWILNPWAGIGATAYRLTHLPPGVEDKEAGNALKDLATSLVGTPGIGISVIEKFFEGDWHGAKSAIGQSLGVLTQPLQVIKDVVGLFSPAEAVQRSPQGSVFGQMEAHVPGLSESLPEQRKPSSSGPIENNPMGRLTGVPVTTALTPVEEEMNRLGVHMPWYPYKGDEAASLKYRDVAGQNVDKIVAPILQSDQYKNAASDAIRRKILEKAVSGAEAVGKAQSGATPEDRMSGPMRAIVAR